MSPKKITESQIIGQQGVNLIEGRLLKMGYLWYPTGGMEAGVDGHLEIRDPGTGEVLNSVVHVQSKATSVAFDRESESGFEYTCEEKDLDYWMQGNAPVVLVVSRPSTDEAYWIPVKEYFADPKIRKARKVMFDKRRDRFDESCREALRKLAVSRDAGIYLSPIPKPERVFSNLLEVTYCPPKLYVADTDFRQPKALAVRLSDLADEFDRSWILKSKRIISFTDLDAFPFNKVCEPGTVDTFDTAEWSDSDDPDRSREFVQLLGRCLTEKCRSLRMSLDPDGEYYYFWPTKDLSPRKIGYRSVSRESARTVFRGYPLPDAPTTPRYYHHLGFSGRFRRLNGKWYLAITPRHRFTTDGRMIDLRSETLLKGLRMLEKNQSVMGQVVFFAEYLRGKPAVDGQPTLYAHLRFGQLVQPQLPVGVDDRQWLPQPAEDDVDEDAPPSADVEQADDDEE